MPSEVIDQQERFDRDASHDALPDVPDALPDAPGGIAHRHARSITLVRHGRTAYNRAGRIQGGIDIPLDETGVWQVRQTAQALNMLYVDGRQHVGQMVVSSDLGRAMTTAHAFADTLGLDVHPDSRMRERNFGDWEGMSADELSRQFPEDFRSWVELRGGELLHGAESKRHVGRRGVEGLAHWSAQAGEQTDLYVFAHGAWIAQTVQTLLGLDQVSNELTGLLSMRNAHWARLVPLDTGGADGGPLWRLMDYNHGPAAADTPQWENPAL